MHSGGIGGERSDTTSGAVNARTAYLCRFGVEFENAAEERLREQEAAEQRRSELLSRPDAPPGHFLLEKLCGHSDKDAALLAGYSLSVAENTKQRVWKPVVRGEFERLSKNLTIQFAANGLPHFRMVGNC